MNKKTENNNPVTETKLKNVLKNYPMKKEVDNHEKRINKLEHS
jgi:hypothetical protein